jgi:hypothetical protein
VSPDGRRLAYTTSSAPATICSSSTSTRRPGSGPGPTSTTGPTRWSCPTTRSTLGPARPYRPSRPWRRRRGPAQLALSHLRRATTSTPAAATWPGCTATPGDHRRARARRPQPGRGLRLRRMRPSLRAVGRPDPGRADLAARRRHDPAVGPRRSCRRRRWRSACPVRRADDTARRAVGFDYDDRLGRAGREIPTDHRRSERQPACRGCRGRLPSGRPRRRGCRTATVRGQLYGRADLEGSELSLVGLRVDHPAWAPATAA